MPLEFLLIKKAHSALGIHSRVFVRFKIVLSNVGQQACCILDLPSLVFILLGPFLDFQQAEVIRACWPEPHLGGYSDYLPIVLVLSPSRSEERRVGKECRSRWSPYH